MFGLCCRTLLIALSIASDDDNKLLLTKRDKALDLTVNNKRIEAQEYHMKNGDQIKFPGYELKVFVRFAKAELKTQGNFLAKTVAIMIFAIIFIELTIAFIIPYVLSKKTVWALEVTRERTHQELVTVLYPMRRRLDQVEDPRKKDLISLIYIEAEKIESYLTNNRESLTQKQLLLALERVKKLKYYLLRIEEEDVFGTMESISSEKSLKQIMKENN